MVGYPSNPIMVNFWEMIDLRKLLRTLFVNSEECYLFLENENVVIKNNDKIITKIPLLQLENILYFGYKGASPSLMGECSKRNIGFCFLTPQGRFLARVSGTGNSNVLLRIRQYQVASDSSQSFSFARNFIVGKIFNARSYIERMVRNHAYSLDKEKLAEVSAVLAILIKKARKSSDIDSLRGFEGNAAQKYFSVFSEFILQNRADFPFNGREKRPPIGRINALLSFVYTILAHDCANALESVGLDAYAGFMHTNRPGRPSLALDMMEEMRSVLADRFVLYLINNQKILSKHFLIKENGATWLNDDGRKILFKAWQEKKDEEIIHPFLREKIKWGLMPYVQSLLLARTLRGDIEEYPVFLWR